MFSLKRSISFWVASGKADCDLIERRPRPILRRTRRPTYMNKTGDALMLLAAARAVTYLPFQPGLVIVVVIVGRLADAGGASAAIHHTGIARIDACAIDLLP